MGEGKTILAQIAATLTLLIACSAGAWAQASAQGPSITLTPFRATGFAPGVYVWATGRDFREGFGQWEWVTYQIRVTILPGNLPCQVIQVNHDLLWFILPRTLPSQIAAIVIEAPLWSELIPFGATPVVPAGPELQPRGIVTHFRNTIGNRFDGTISFPPGILVSGITLFAGGFGNTRDWIVQVSGPVGGEVEARAFPLSSAFGTETLNFQLPALPPGDYQFSAYSAADSLLKTNTITLRVE